MASLTPSEITQLRQRPHRSVIHMGIFEPQSLVEMQINQPSIAKGAREIIVTILSGDIDDVEKGMTAYIGGTQGQKNIGRLRAITGSGTTLTLAENDYDWENGWFITVTIFREPWAVFPRITLDAKNRPTFYKDYDLVYLDEGRNFDPVVHMGGNVAGFMETGAFGVYYSSTGSFVPDSTISTYSWIFEGNTNITGSTDADPGWVQYIGVGHFTTRLTITAATGKEFTGTRHVLVYNKPDEGPARTFVRWGLRSFEGSREKGGYSVDVWVIEEADANKVVEGALIVLFTEDWEGSVRGKEIGRGRYRDNILFVGYVQDDSIRKNFATNRIEFRAVSITERMDSLSTYSATLESKRNPNSWNEARYLTVDKALISYLRWQSTILQIADVSQTGDTLPVQYADFARGSLYAGANGFLQNTLFASLIADRGGKLWAEIDLSLTPTGSRTSFNTAMNMTDQDWRGEINIKEQSTPIVAYVELGGIAYSGPETGSNTPIISSAPGDPADYFGSVQRQSGLVLAGQGQLNDLVALTYNKINSRFPRIDIPIAGDYRHIDIAPQERVEITLAAADNFRGLIWNGKKFVPQEIFYEYNPVQNLLLMNIAASEETEGLKTITGRKVNIPVDPPYDTPDLPEFEFPDFPPIPPIPPFPDVPGPEPPPLVEEYVYVIYFDNTVSGRVFRTQNFWELSGPNWEEVSISAATDIVAFRIGPDGSMWIMTASDGLYKSSGAGFVQSISDAELKDIITNSGNIHYVDLQINPIDPAHVVFFGNGNKPGGPHYQVAVTFDGGDTWDENDVGTMTGAAGPGSNPLSPGFLAFDDLGTILYASLAGSGNDEAQIYYSINGGKNIWFRTLDELTGNTCGGVRDLVISGQFTVLASYLDRTRFASCNLARLIYSVDGLENRIDVTMQFGAFGWVGTTAGKDHNGQRSLRVHPADGMIYGMFVQQATTNPETVFARSASFGGGWELLRFWDSFERHGFQLNAGDPSKFYAFKSITASIAGPATIIGSDDGGRSWADRNGDILTVASTTQGDLGQPLGFIATFGGDS